MASYFKKIHLFVTSYNVYFLLLLAITVGLPLSKFLMSLGTIFIVVQWFITGNIITKFSLFFKNKIAVICSLTFFVFLLGLTHTSNFEYGMNDLRIKIPLLVFPIIFSTSPKLKPNHFKWLLGLFIFATFLSTFYGYLGYKNFITPRKEITDFRGMSQFISHIRLSLMVVLSLFLLPILTKDKKGMLILALLLFGWFVFFLSLIESATGFVIGGITFFFLSIYLFFIKKKRYALLPVALAFTIGIVLFIILNNTYQKVKMDVVEPLDKVTAQGNPYDKNFNYVMFDNGNFSNVYVCLKELKQTWETKSKIPFNGMDKQGYFIQFTLIRYLTSKGYRKDEEGVNKLTPQDIQNIEMGFANYLQASNNIMNRLKILMFEIDGYFHGANVNGNSLGQRLEYWKTSKKIVTNNFWIGVGTGDVADAFKAKYSENTTLSEQFQLRSHNQYLSTFIALGFVGVVIFILTFILPLQYAIKKRNYFYFVFASIVLLSFLSEDTLETQDGVYLFAFFNSLFLFLIPPSFINNQHSINPIFRNTKIS